MFIVCVNCKASHSVYKNEWYENTYVRVLIATKCCLWFYRWMNVSEIKDKNDSKIQNFYEFFIKALCEYILSSQARCNSNVFVCVSFLFYFPVMFHQWKPMNKWISSRHAHNFKVKIKSNIAQWQRNLLLIAIKVINAFLFAFAVKSLKRNSWHGSIRKRNELSQTDWLRCL